MPDFQRLTKLIVKHALVQIQRLPGGWCLVGNGPSYLLFCPNKEVLHLASSLDWQLRQDLKGYRAIDEQGELVPLVWALLHASADAIYQVGPAAAKHKRPTYISVRS